MKKWQQFISEHGCKTEIINDTQVKVYDLSDGYTIVTKENKNSYFAESFLEKGNERIDTYAYESVRQYLGY